MRKTIHRAFCGAALFCLVSCGGVAEEVAPARGGLIDLRAVDLVNHTAALDGEWEMFWGQYLSPTGHSAPSGPTHLHPVPLPWNAVGLPGQGFATYRLRAILPKLAPGTMMGLRVPDLNTAYRLYVNGHLVAGAGKPDIDAASTKSAFRPDIALFPAEKELRFVVHVANFAHRKGGLDETLRLGSATVIRTANQKRTAQTLFVFGCILVAGLYDLFRFFLRPQDRRALYFSLFCFFMALRTLTTGQYFLSVLWPSVPFQLLLKLEYLTLYGGIPLIAAFFRDQFPGEFSPRVRNVVLAVSAVFGAFVLLTPLLVFNRSLVPYFFIAVVFIGYAVARVSLAAKRGREGAVAVLIGGIVFAVAAILDMLHNQYVLRSAPSLAPYGMLAFIFAQSFILAKSSARSAATAELLSSDLEERVMERTHELQESRNSLQRTMSELAEARDRAEESSRLKSEFVAVMSHEIRTPLNSIIGLSTLLRETARSAEQKDLTDVLSRSAENLARLIDDILDFSRIEAGRLTLEVRHFQVRTVVDNAMKMVAFRAREKGLRLDRELVRLPEGELLGDPGRLEQILVNLIGNGVKFTERGLVHVRVSVIRQTKSEAYLRFRIADTGIGIPEEFLERIFESFTQADGSTTRRYGGTGLGLAICKRLTRLMGGSLRAESIAGEGSVFTLDLPFTVPLRPSEVQAEEGLYLRPGVQVLVAEDNPDNRLLLRQYLKGQPVEVYEALNGLEALSAVQETDFDVVLMDVRMPVMDGYEAVRRIRQWETEQLRERVPILALTANASHQDMAMSLAAGCDEHISKPVDRRRLLEALKRYTDRIPAQ